MLSTNCLSYLEKQIDVFKLKGNLKVGNKPEVTFEIHSHMCVYQISVIV